MNQKNVNFLTSSLTDELYYQPQKIWSSSEIRWPAAPRLTSQMIMWPEVTKMNVPLNVLQNVLLKGANYQANIPSHHRLICHSKQRYQQQGTNAYQQLSVHSSSPSDTPTL